MIRFTRWAVGLVAFSTSVSAFAQAEEPVTEPAPEATTAPVSEGNANVAVDSGGADKKIKLGLRLGYALPLGDVAKDVKMSDGISGQIPIWIDAGYMVTPNILVGLYGQYGIVQTEKCTDCSAHDIRIGVQAQYHLSPAESVDPWLGLGVGYEILGASQAGLDSSFKGFEFLNLQGGADFKVSNAFTVGPFLSLSVGQYTSISAGDLSLDIPDKAIHEWLTFGAKGTFGL